MLVAVLSNLLQEFHALRKPSQKERTGIKPSPCSVSLLVASQSVVSCVCSYPPFFGSTNNHLLLIYTHTLFFIRHDDFWPTFFTYIFGRLPSLEPASVVMMHGSTLIDATEEDRLLKIFRTYPTSKTLIVKLTAFSFTLSNICLLRPN